jgi:hypothetical protein
LQMRHSGPLEVIRGHERSPPLADAPCIDDRAVGRLGDDVHVLVLVRRGARVVRRDGEQATNRVPSVLERSAIRRAHLTALLLEIGDAIREAIREAIRDHHLTCLRLEMQLGRQSGRQSGIIISPA